MEGGVYAMTVADDLPYEFMFVIQLFFLFSPIQFYQLTSIYLFYTSDFKYKTRDRIILSLFRCALIATLSNLRLIIDLTS